MAEPMAMFEFQEEVVQAGKNLFVPSEAYEVFRLEHMADLDAKNMRVFFLRAYDAKQKLKTTTAKTVTLKFGTAVYKVVNNHNDRNANMEIYPTDLTLHRISGFMARHVKYLIEVDSTTADYVKGLIINPIAESLGITWSAGLDIYLSFFPGAEMFMEEFHFFPLAIGIYRVQQGEMKAEFLKKHLRQQCGKIPASQWMITHKEQIRIAVSTVAKLPWGKSGLSAAARTFLADFGIKL
ncbi:N [Benfica virus]|uniref:Nucleoprotein n=1 Tax=Benfica virus TaxID=2748204 RepID=A0A7D5DSB4_9VIRU|nr:N [Benfica virus] [Benfica virus]QLA47082.1 N [Benfica virus] [Benfica virus]